MASKQLLRRLPLFAREGWSASVNSGSVGVGAGALPEVTHDILPIVRDSADSPRHHGAPGVPMAGSSVAHRAHHKLPHNAAAGQTLGKWTHRLSHLAEPLQKPLATLGVPAAATAADLTRTAWPALAIPPGTTATAGVSPSKQGPAIPTAIAAATLPAIADLIKQQSRPSTTVSGAKGDKDAAMSPASVLGSSGSSEASAGAVAVDAAMLEPSSASITSQAHQPQPQAQPMPAPAPAPQMQQLPPPHPHHQQRRSSSGAGGMGGRGGGAASSSIQLNKHIMACRNTEELLALVQARGAHFDYFNISTALARVPKLAAASGPGGASGMASSYAGYGGAPPPPPPPPPSAGGNGFSNDGSGALAHLGQGGSSAGGVLPGDLHVDAAGRLLLDHLAALMVSQINSFDARGLANSAWAFGKLKYVPAAGTSLPNVIAAAALRRMGEFSPQNLSNLVWSFVYMHHVDEALLAAAARYVVARVGEFKPQELANIVWAFASLGHRDEQMLHVVASQAQRIAPLFKEQELSNVLWALGKMGLRHRPDVLEALMAETRTKLPAFLPQGISNVAWALAAVGHVDELFLDRVVGQCGRQLGAFDVQALANLVWAMASLGYYQPHFLGAVVNECLGRGLDRLSPQNLSNILWGCATLGHRDPRMLSAWAAQTLEKLASFEPQGLSNTAWAFARLGFHSPQLFQALAAAALHKIDGFTAQGLSNLAWAMATAGHAQPRLFEALARQAAALAPTGAFNAQNCSVTLWAAASLRHYDEALFDAMLRRLVAALGEGGGAEADGCEPQNIANALWAVARMGHPLPAEAAAPLLRHVVGLMPRMSQQELCNSMWAVAVMDRMDEQLWAAFCDCLTRLPDISPEGMHQAYHAQLMFHSHLARAAGVPLSKLQALEAGSGPAGSGARGLLPRLPEPLHTVAASMWAASARDVHVSRFHQEVSGALAVAGVPHALEWMTDDQHFSVDIGLQVNARPTAVEVNGSHHYASNDPQRSLGDTAVRRRLLQDRGWNVVDVGFADWESMGRTLAERGSNLVGRIAASMDDWDWRYVGLPQRSAAGAAAPPPAAVVAPSPQPAAAAAPSTAAAAALAAQQQQEQQQAAAAQALAAAMGLGPLFPSAAAAAASAFSSVATPAGPALDFDLDLELAGLAGWSASSPFTELSALALAGGMGGMGAQLADRTASSGSAMDEASVTAAVEAAEALGAMPGGSLLLQQQVYDVLGLSRSAGMLAALQAQAAAQQAAALGHGASHHGNDEQVVSDDDLERVVQFALA
ncbi:hypothetical protein HXX76_009107 [Chlamydomonas incerta]|uniref:RAP domain-containing protein n=1 Tax=Chlamydomonas incerta TaxID=51695 RepID=A0A835SRV8_CHLIN|nr:hypothetical protein HXX76_009107 [Chlamydomonas incerta]|eukprot:KAG2432187.1 hypothetical protein HXX76_009107 [Chlamydomonas incerta]